MTRKDCKECDNRGFVSSPQWEEWTWKFEQAREAGAGMAAALRAAGERPSCPEEQLCTACHGASAPPANASEALRHLTALGVASPEVSLSVSQDFLGRRKVVAQVWDGRDWVRAGTLAEAVQLVRTALTGDHTQDLASADSAIEEATPEPVTWAF